MAFRSGSIARLGIAGMTAVVVLGEGLALGQEKTSLPDVTVQAQREATITRGPRVGASSKNIGQLVTLTRRINVSGLDLTTASGDDELNKRIEAVAKEACNQLKRLYPIGTNTVPGYEHTNENCVSDAVASARMSADQDIAQARKQ